MSDRVIALKHELREARAWMTDKQLAEVVVRCAAYGEGMHPNDLRALLAEFRPAGSWDSSEHVAQLSVAARKRQERAERIVDLWAQGLRGDEIAPLMGMSVSALKSEVCRLRQRGFRLEPRPQATRSRVIRKVRRVAA